MPNKSSLPPGLMRRAPLEPLEKSTPATAASESTKMEEALVEDETVTYVLVLARGLMIEPEAGVGEAAIVGANPRNCPK